LGDKEVLFQYSYPRRGRNSYQKQKPSESSKKQEIKLKKASHHKSPWRRPRQKNWNFNEEILPTIYALIPWQRFTRVAGHLIAVLKETECFPKGWRE
jgi:hypothetical protein